MQQRAVGGCGGGCDAVRALTLVLAERKDWVRVYGDKNAVAYAGRSLVPNPH